MNRCSSCGEGFASAKLFDLHRVGVHAYSYSEGVALDGREDGRRCLTPEEMEAKGWSRNQRGEWGDPVEGARVRDRFSRSGSRPDGPGLPEAA